MDGPIVSARDDFNMMPHWRSIQRGKMSRVKNNGFSWGWYRRHD
ncbi:hypothetical protein [uncultured Erythrobacter sp.]|nr:hypothetical protein [uncultured Erythrobacter sp.]